VTEVTLDVHHNVRSRYKQIPLTGLFSSAIFLN